MARAMTSRTPAKPRAARGTFRAIVTPAPFMPRLALILGPVAVEFLPNGAKRGAAPKEDYIRSFKRTDDENSRAWVGAWKVKASRSKTSAGLVVTRTFGKLTATITGSTLSVDDLLNDDVWSWKWELTRKAEPRKSIDAVAENGSAGSFELAAYAVLSRLRGVEAQTCGLAALVRGTTKARPFEPRPGEVEQNVKFVQARTAKRVDEDKPTKSTKAKQTGLAFG